MKKIAKIICPFVFVLFSFVAFAQDTKDNQVYDFVQRMPEFPGGQDSLNSYLIQNLVYPDSAQKNGIQGKVFIGFIVETDGTISNVKIVGNKTYGYGLEEEGLRVINMMPNWTPGTQNGKPVRVKFTLPINFKIQN